MFPMITDLSMSTQYATCKKKGATWLVEGLTWVDIVTGRKYPEVISWNREGTQQTGLISTWHLQVCKVT